MQWLAPRFVALSMALLGLAGCTGSDDSPVVQSESQAPVASHSPETGSIAGIVTDEELVPIAGATVGLLSTGVQVKTSANGSYAFSELVPGSHQVAAEALGFKSVAKRVEVKAGETARADFGLAPQELVSEAYLLSVSRIIHLNLDGPWSIDTTEGTYVNVSLFQDLRCSPCYGIIYYSPGPKGGQSEMKWSGTYVSPVTNTMIMRYVRNWTSDTGVTTTGTLVNRVILPSGGLLAWPDTAMSELRKGVDKVKMFITIPRDSVAVNVRVETWTTFSYHGPIPEDFSAFPKA